MQPEGGRMHFLFGHGEVSRANVFAGIKPELLETDNLAVHPRFAMQTVGIFNNSALLEFRQDSYLGVIDRVRIVIAIHSFHVSLALLVIEAFDVELLRLMQVNRLLMERG